MKSSQDVLKDEESKDKAARHYRHVQGPVVGSAPRLGNIGKDSKATKTFIERPQGNRIGSDPSYGNIGSNPKGKF